VLAPICTPFAQDGEICLDAMRRNIALYNRTGLLGYVVTGSTGEAAMLGKEEKRCLFEAVRDSADGKVLIAGTGAESVRETLSQIRDAAGFGYDAALVITPHYYRGQMARPEAQAAFFRAVADSSPIPVLIYNFPQMTGIDLAVELVAELAGHPNIHGIKESSADIDKIGALIKGVPATFPVVVGPSSKLHASLLLGATGGITAFANAAPVRTLRIYDRYRAGDIDGSGAAQQQILEAAGVAPKYGIQGLKYAMDLKGFYGGPARLPLLPLDSTQKTEIELLFRDIEDVR
jgi:dihydrodipicolinate synthase/N-acetylneuraminate lyase